MALPTRSASGYWYAHVESSMTRNPSPTAARTARQTSMSTSGSVGGWILYAVQPSDLKRAASSAYASFEASTAELAYAGTRSRYEPSRRWIGSPATLPPMSQSATSMAPMARSVVCRFLCHIAW